MGDRVWKRKKEAQEAFEFDVISAGILPGQLVVDNQGKNALSINGEQSFLEDAQGNLWPMLSRTIAYKRALKYSKTGQILKEGTYSDLLVAMAGSIFGAAIGIVTGENVGYILGKGAAVGDATGAVLGG